MNQLELDLKILGQAQTVLRTRGIDHSVDLDTAQRLIHENYLMRLTETLTETLDTTSELVDTLRGLDLSGLKNVPEAEVAEGVAKLVEAMGHLVGVRDSLTTDQRQKVG